MFRNKNKYMKLFEKRFKSKVNISIEKNDEDFYIDFIHEIREEYKKIIKLRKNNGDNDYIIKEKIRLEANLRILDRSGSNEIYTTLIFSSMLPIVIFGIGKLIDNTNDSTKFIVEKKLASVPNLNSIDMNKVVDEFSNYSTAIHDIVMNFTIGSIVYIAIAIIIVKIINMKVNNIHNRNIAFNKMCLEAIKDIEKES
ncbi:MAG: hypothetical protein AB2417_19370 [Clostridiaceae bacterium]